MDLRSGLFIVRGLPLLLDRCVLTTTGALVCSRLLLADPNALVEDNLLVPSFRRNPFKAGTSVRLIGGGGGGFDSC